MRASTSFILADFCPPAGRIQTPCGAVQVWQTIKLEDACDECRAYFPDKPWRKGGRGSEHGNRSPRNCPPLIPFVFAYYFSFCMSNVYGRKVEGV